MKIIFLDIDGVLNTDKWETYMHSNGLPLGDEFGIYFDKDAVKNLAKIIAITKAQIVIHSTWKLGKPLEWVQSLWKKRKLPGNVFAITPDIPPCFNKKDEINIWLINNSYVSNYIILDDEDEFSTVQHKHFVKIDSTIGISAENINDAVIKLSI